MKNDKTLQTAESPGAQARCRATPSNRILVVDDDIDLRLLNAGVLVRSGCQVDTAEDGAAAWATLHAKGYDLLITDNNMPKVSGVELVKKVRSAHMTMPVILASGALLTDELERNPWLQPVATLVKPFTGGQLLETVNQVLAQSIIPAAGMHCRPGALTGRLCEPGTVGETPHG
jgi:DNA-binding NtrC family response regulator